TDAALVRNQQSSHGTRDAEADTVRVGVGWNLMAIRASQHVDVVAHPGAAAENAQAARLGAVRVVHAVGAVVLRVVPIRYPLPDVADHVEETEAVWRVRSGGTSASPIFVGCIGQVVAVRRVADFSPGIPGALCATAGGLFPLSFRRETHET